MKRKTYMCWPIRVEWKSAEKHDSRLLSWFTWHGWQAGWAGFSHGIFGWTFHIGRLVVIFGKDVIKKGELITFPVRNIEC